MNKIKWWQFWKWKEEAEFRYWQGLMATQEERRLTKECQRMEKEIFDLKIKLRKAENEAKRLEQLLNQPRKSATTRCKKV